MMGSGLGITRLVDVPKWRRYSKFKAILLEDALILHSQYHGCCNHGDAGREAINGLSKDKVFQKKES